MLMLIYLQSMFIRKKSLTLMATATHDLWLVLVLATHIYLRFG